jgi:hypothetical protein
MCQCTVTTDDRVRLRDAEYEFIKETKHLEKYAALLPYKTWGLCPEHDGRLRGLAIGWVQERRKQNAAKEE